DFNMIELDYDDLFMMLEDKKKDISRLNFEVSLLEREITSRANKSLVRSRAYSALSSDELFLVINSKNFKIKNTKKEDYMEDITKFIFEYNGNTFYVSFTKNINNIDTRYFDERELDLFKVFFSEGCCSRVIGKGIRLAEVESIVTEWSENQKYIERSI
ncbi:MAG: hypothetical protein ACRCZ0_08585, partial [Cetobacterium sp.]